MLQARLNSPSRRLRTASIAALLAAGVIGCESDGLSLRETPGRDSGTYAYAMRAADVAAPDVVGMVEAGGDERAAPAKRPTLPAKLAVAQLGELAPPAEMIEQLRGDTKAFARIEPISGVAPSRSPEIQHPDRRAPEQTTATEQRDAREHARVMRRYARELGDDYLFLFGGTVDQATTDTPLTAANATIIGMFVVPSEKIEAQVKAAGTLVEAATGKVVLSVSADATGERMTPRVARDGDQIKLLKSLRDEVTRKLTAQLRERVKESASASTAG
jgi:hypothetical protein